ncbi:MAG: hypothetical protein H0U10_17240, partial [Chloroflexia bacterium]|nr:hypothetical protein [Chloroflexia bacterium]
DVPARFLPPNVTLLDTPGLGSLYAAHAQVTQRFVPYADAVIFALDSGQPITDLELGFVETILGATGNILFIQTKIDQQRRAHWEAIQARNQEILAKRFGDRLPDTRVWPIGSRLLLQGAETDDDDFVIRSRQRDLGIALETFLFRVAGWSRAANALTAAGHFHAASVATLRARQQALTERSEGERDELQAAAEARRREFDTVWGAGGERRRTLLADLRNAGVAGGQRFSHAITADGEIAHAQQTRIAALERIEDVRWMGEVLGSDTVKAAVDAWRQASEGVRQRYLHLLEPFAQDAEAMGWVLSVEQPDLGGFRAPRDLRPEWVEALPRSARDEGLAMPLAKGTLDVLMLDGLIAPPEGVAAAAVSLAWTAARRFLVSDKAQIREAKLALREHLDATLDQIERHFLRDPMPAFGGRTLVDGYYAAMEETIARQVQAVAEQRSADAQAEILRLAAESRSDSQHRRDEAGLIDRQLAEWDRLGGALRALMADLTALDESVTTAPAAMTERT